MKVLVALSGGVDSSVAAAELIDAGHHVVGITMRLWGGESDTGCCSVADVDDARRVAQQLDIDHLVFNFSDDFNTHVVDPYVRAHSEGLTPNPCIECNRVIKFDELLATALPRIVQLTVTAAPALVRPFAKRSTQIQPPSCLIRTVRSDAGVPAGGPFIGDFISCREGGATCAGLPVYAAVTARSFHAGMVNVVLMDGSVRSVNDGVDLTIWRCLGSRNDGKVIGEY
jgi:hypothetical protein